MHELLETETITASVLRYKLQYFPSDIKNEIQGINTVDEYNLFLFLPIAYSCLILGTKWNAKYSLVMAALWMSIKTENIFMQ